MHFTDALTLDAPRRTSDGFLAVRARASRTGVYQYSGREVDPDNAHGLRDQAVVNVLRDDATVFDEAAVRSFIGKPVTDDHPSEAVTAANWRDHARGTIMGALRDGDYLAFDILLTDAATIAKVDAGKRELSNGYGASLEYGSFTAKDGTACQARQAKITGGNHVALVDRGRAGSECAIKDGFAICDAMTADELNRLKASANLPNGDTPMKTMTIDGLKVPNVSDEAEAAITKLLSDKAAAESRATTAETSIAAKDTEISTKDAEIATLKQAVEDAKVTPAQLRDAAKAYAEVCDKAKALGVTVADNADADAIMKAVVDAKMGDKAKDWTADQIAASFAVITADAQPQDRDAFRGVRPIGDASIDIKNARAQWLADKATAYRAKA